MSCSLCSPHALSHGVMATRMARNGILVIGSANMDMVVTTQRFPSAGETVFGRSFNLYPGGKGANQAVAAARLGGRVFFIGRMGRDMFRPKLCAAMRRSGVSLRGTSVDPAAPTGIALIAVDRSGQNEIVVLSGSNMALMPKHVDHERRLFSRVKVVLTQLEIPLPTVRRALRHASHHGLMVILNPAPAQELTRPLLRGVDVLTPNETELEILSGVRVTGVGSAERAARRLLARGVGIVLVTLGAQGCLLVRGRQAQVFQAPAVRPVDTTAAGDTFNGALAFGLAEGRGLDDAIRFANEAAAYSVTRRGAQSSMPTMRELRAFLARGRRS